MKAPLPPLSAIRAFEAAARLGNFTRASEELGMTQSAVSYQIRILEERVGAQLFLRRTRGVALTETGRRLARQSSIALDILRDAFSDAQTRSQDSLVVSVGPTFASAFLTGRLNQFQILHPEIDVRVEVTQDVVDFTRSQVDVSIRSGPEAWPDLTCHHLFESKLSPMLSPRLAETIGGVREPADLLKLPLLEPGDPWWAKWFAAAELAYRPVQALEAKMTFGMQALEANAILAGYGVGKLDPFFYGDLLEEGQIIQPFPLIWPENLSFWLVCPTDHRNSPKIKAFRDWLLEEIR